MHTPGSRISGSHVVLFHAGDCGTVFGGRMVLEVVFILLLSHFLLLHAHVRTR